MLKKVDKNLVKKSSGLIYALVFLAVVLSILTPVSLVNIFYDPGEIYFQKLIKARYLDSYIKLLLTSPFGVKQFGNERMVKARLAEVIGQNDNVIIGSSRVMQISNLRMAGFRKAFPGRSLNLGVSGGSLEDLFIFSQIISRNAHLPRTIIIGIDPWGLKWRMDSRYIIFQENLEKMISELGVKAIKKQESALYKLFRNSISFEYFLASLQRVLDPSFTIIPKNDLQDYGKVGEFDFTKGYDFAVTLCDGSHVYDKTYIEKHRTSKEFISYENYKLEGEYYDEAAIKTLEKLILYLKSKGPEVYVVLSPYHHSFFRDENASYSSRVIEVEKRIKQIALSTDIRMFGSYDPRKMNIAATEFYDEMHAMASALDKVGFNH